MGKLSLMSLPKARTLARRLSAWSHLEGHGGRTRDGDDRVAVEIDHLVGAVVHDDVAGGGAAVSRDEHAVFVVKGKHCGRLDGGWRHRDAQSLRRHAVISVQSQ
jgi:hypothetical protein